MGVNPKSSIFIGFSTFNHPCWGCPFMETYISMFQLLDDSWTKSPVGHLPGPPQWLGPRSNRSPPGGSELFRMEQQRTHPEMRVLKKSLTEQKLRFHRAKFGLRWN